MDELLGRISTGLAVAFMILAIVLTILALINVRRNSVIINRENLLKVFILPLYTITLTVNPYFILHFILRRLNSPVYDSRKVFSVNRVLAAGDYWGLLRRTY